jgi:hypothetical protein
MYGCLEIWGAHTAIGPEKQASKPAVAEAAGSLRRLPCDEMSAGINFFCIPAAPPWNDIARAVVGLVAVFHFRRRAGGFSARQ